MYKLITESPNIPSNFTGIVELGSGTKYWLINGKQVSEQEHKEYVDNLNKSNNTFDGKLVEIDGKKYKLISVD